METFDEDLKFGIVCWCDDAKKDLIMHVSSRHR